MNRTFSAYRKIGHRRVDGWLEAPALDMLKAIDTAQRELGIDGGVAEIGVHHGRLFIGMHLLGKSGEKSLAIDLFADQQKNVDKSGMGDEFMFHRNLGRFGDRNDDVVVHSGDSTRMSGADVKALLGSTVRMFSVDGGHTAEIVHHDMQTAEDALSPGGVVVADDVFNEEWPGVAEGTARYLAGAPSLVPFAIGFNKVLFTQEGYVDSFRKAIADIAVGANLVCKESVMHGYPVDILVLLPIKIRIRRRVGDVPGLKNLYYSVRRIRRS